MKTMVSVNKQAILDLVRVKDDFDTIVESLELMSDKDFMDSYRKSKEQIKKKKVGEVSEDPTRYKHLHYDLSGSCRLWIGKLRIIFSYDINKKELYLEKIVFGHKYTE